MHETKAQLILLNGMKCMGCGKETRLKDLQWHHIKPKYVSKKNTYQRNYSFVEFMQRAERISDFSTDTVPTRTG